MEPRFGIKGVPGCAGRMSMDKAGKACRRYLMVLAAVVTLLLVSANGAQAATANEKTVYSFLTDTMGYNPAAACGVMSTIYCESRFTANINGLGGAYGICQWGGVRRTRLISWCSSHGYNYTTLSGQLRFMQYELKTYFPRVNNYLKSVTNTSKGAYNAGFYWCYYFEIPANTYSTAVYRGNLAKSRYWSSMGSSSTWLSAAVAENGIKLTWNATSKYGYVVKRALKLSGNYETVATVSGSKKSYTDHSVAIGKKYYYYIQPLDSSGKELDRSNKVSCDVKPSLQDSECRIILSKTEYTYDGKAKKPKVTVIYGDERLSLNRDYTVAYSDNKSAGTAYVKVTGKGEYAGYLKLSFTIHKAEQKITASDIRVYYKRGRIVPSGASAAGKLSYSSANEKVAAVKNGKIYLKGAGITTITVKAAATANYKAASATITLKVLPGATSFTKVVQKGSSLQLTWKTYQRVTGYEIQYAKGSSLKNPKTVTISDKSTATTVLKNLTKGKTYCLRIRCYKLEGSKKLNGAWSQIRKVVLKK